MSRGVSQFLRRFSAINPHAGSHVGPHALHRALHRAPLLRLQRSSLFSPLWTKPAYTIRLKPDQLRLLERPLMERSFSFSSGSRIGHHDKARAPLFRVDLPTPRTSGPKPPLSTSLVPVVPKEHALVERFLDPVGERFSMQAKMLASYQKAKASTDPAANTKFVQETLPAHFARLRQTGLDPKPVVANDALVQLSYMELQNGTKFDLTLSPGQANLFGLKKTGKVSFELVDQFTQTVDQRGIAALPKDTPVGTGYHIWKIKHAEGETHAVVFRGTNSDGARRDVKLGDKAGTGATANSTYADVGAGVAEHFLALPGSPLKKYAEKIGAVIGHSLGGALAQHYVRGRIERGESVPHAYFASAPGMNKPAPEGWDGAKSFYAFSRQDPVVLAGSYSYPGKYLNPGMGGVPVSGGLADSTGDGLLSQHGSAVGSLVLMRDGDVAFKAQEQTHHAKATAFAMLDYMRVFAVDMAFKPLLRERVLRHLDSFGLTRELAPTSDPKGPRGKELAYLNEAATALIQGSPLVAAHYQAAPELTLRTIAAQAETLKTNPELGRENVRKALILHGEIDVSARAMGSTDSLSLNKDLRKVAAIHEQM